ncbi:unnamed protein product [Caenorhabditis auriculariae]|uniref:Uncharacterized protein n=1 Tax=Caenorhabditis auriculariae TaxID=2777116 RepID=A0A8S1HL54_9PELO|nr:unnamed protein product [Caenorhabditis auriculariae]
MPSIKLLVVLPAFISISASAVVQDEIPETHVKITKLGDSNWTPVWSKRSERAFNENIRRSSIRWGKRSSAQEKQWQSVDGNQLKVSEMALGTLWTPRHVAQLQTAQANEEADTMPVERVAKSVRAQALRNKIGKSRIHWGR